jgi:trimeric autotransporter adhesin
MAKFYPAPASGGGSSDFVVDGYNARGGDQSAFDDNYIFQTAIGSYATTTLGNATALGGNSQALGDGSTSVGYGANSSGLESIAVGVYSNVSGEKAIGIGQGANASGQNSIAIGTGARASGTYSVNIGNEYEAEDSTILLGSNNAISLAIPGLGLYTGLALDGQVLGWSATGGNSGTGGFVWSNAAPPSDITTTFPTGDGGIVTVTNGIITNISYS